MEFRRIQGSKVDKLNSQLEEVGVRQRIKDIVAKAPPLTNTQREVLASLLCPTPEVRIEHTTEVDSQSRYKFICHWCGRGCDHPNGHNVSCPRSGRKMPSVEKILNYWTSSKQRHVFDINESYPHCFKCYREYPEWDNRYFERCHLIDRVFDGLDHEGNLVLLCSDCHRIMPCHKNGDEAKAIAWVKESIYKTYKKIRDGEYE